MSTTRSRTAHRLAAAGVALAALAPVGVAAAGDRHRVDEPQLEGRAVLPVETYAKGPASGAALVVGSTDPDGDGEINGIQFPTPSQPVEGFSGLVEGRGRGEWLTLADNGYGGKANSKDFNIRAYYLKPDFKTADGGRGGVAVRHWIEFSDPHGVIGFPIVNEGTKKRILTGGDIDPESIQRGRDGTFWIGDEFGPWILHFDARGRLLEAPYGLPGNLTSPNHPTTPSSNVQNSGGFEAMALSADGRSLSAIVEKASLGDLVGERKVFEFDIHSRTFTQVGTYAVEIVPTATNPDPVLVADAQSLDDDRLLVIERDNNGGGLSSTYRSVYEVDLGNVDAAGHLVKREVVDLTHIADPDLVSLPAIHDGDVGLGDPFMVVCESIEALRIMSPHRLLLACDNNFPNKARNPGLADDSEFITVRIP